MLEWETEGAFKELASSSRYMRHLQTMVEEQAYVGLGKTGRRIAESAGLLALPPMDI